MRDGGSEQLPKRPSRAESRGRRRSSHRSRSPVEEARSAETTTTPRRSSWLYETIYGGEEPHASVEPADTTTTSRRSSHAKRKSHKKRDSKAGALDDGDGAEESPGPDARRRLSLQRDMSTLMHGQQRIEELKQTTKSKRKGHAVFPKQEDAWVPVTDPRSWYRLRWDMFILVLIFYVMLVTPFHIAFLADVNVADLAKPGSEGQLVLAAVNACVDLLFVIDILCIFNQGYFDKVHEVWIIDR